MFFLPDSNSLVAQIDRKMKRCAGKTDDALHGTCVLAVRMPGGQAGCLPMEGPAKQSTFPAAVGSMHSPVSR